MGQCPEELHCPPFLNTQVPELHHSNEFLSVDLNDLTSVVTVLYRLLFNDSS